MVFFGRGKKKDNSAKQDIIDGIANNKKAENAVITYILLQAQENNISLAKKDDITYISFRNKEISNFLKEWYTLLLLYQHKKLSDKMYEIFIQSQLTENKITENKKDSESGIDEIENYL